MRCQICVFSLYSAEQSTFVVCFDDDDADRHNHDLLNNYHDHLNNIIIIIIFEWSASPDFLLNNEFAASFGFFSARQTWSAICQPQNIRETTKNEKKILIHCPKIRSAICQPRNIRETTKNKKKILLIFNFCPKIWSAICQPQNIQEISESG